MSNNLRINIKVNADKMVNAPTCNVRGETAQSLDVVQLTTIARTQVVNIRPTKLGVKEYPQIL